MLRGRSAVCISAVCETKQEAEVNEVIEKYSWMIEKYPQNIASIVMQVVADPAVSIDDFIAIAAYAYDKIDPPPTEGGEGCADAPI